MTIVLDKVTRNVIAVCETIQEARIARMEYGIEKTVVAIPGECGYTTQAKS